MFKPFGTVFDPRRVFATGISGVDCTSVYFVFVAFLDCFRVCTLRNPAFGIPSAHSPWHFTVCEFIVFSLKWLL